MKKISYVLMVILLISNSIKAQEISGEVFYEKVVLLDDNRYDDNYKLTEEQKVELMAMNSKLRARKSVLQFNTSQSRYEEKAILNNKEISIDGNHTVIHNLKPKFFYHDYEKKQRLSKKQIFDEYYLVKEGLPKNDWKLEDEIKEIAGYICHKAVKEEDGDIHIAWYTKAIQTNAGPETYYGLPGLIMEVNSSFKSGNEITITSSKVELDNNYNLLEQPNSDDAINRSEFDKIAKLKVKEYMDRPIEENQVRKVLKIDN